jgi:hypothetical protein
MTTIDAARVLRLAAAGCAAVLVAAITSVPAQAAATDIPSGNDKIKAEVLMVNGSGCPGGSVVTIPSPDNTGFRIGYLGFTARDSGNSLPTSRRNCLVSVQLTIPQGFTLAVASADYRGGLALADGATAVHTTTYYFQGDSANHVSEETFNGPRGGFWHNSDSATALVYAPCRTSIVLNINTALRVDSEVGTNSWIAMATSSGSVATLFNFSWRRC